MSHLELNYFEFQFQNGSIKSSKLLGRLAILDSFQFQNGSIKSYSIFRVKFLIIKFQFQNGSIKSPTSTCRDT